MRARLTLLLLASALAVTGLQLGAGAAVDTRTTVRMSTTSPLIGETVRLTGALTPVRRVVYLQRYVDHAWRTVSTTRTGVRGQYAFNVRTYGTDFAYRTYARSLRYAGHSYYARLSNILWVKHVTPRLTLSVDSSTTVQPGSTSDASATAPASATATGRVEPPRPGAVVEVQAFRDGDWHTVGTGVQDGGGNYAAPVLVTDLGTADAPAVLRAASGTAGSSQTSSTSVSPTYRNLVFSDDFDGTALDPAKWGSRTAAEQAGPPDSTKRRACSSVTDNSQVSVADGVATFGVSRRTDPKLGCDAGRFYNSMIGTGSAGLTFTHGVFAARIKFNQAQGGHGAFWLQGPFVTGAELDVAEYFGDGRRDGGLTSFVHYTDAQGVTTSVGQPTDYSAILGSETPSSGYHVYSVEWTSSGYVFRIDGVEVLRTDQPHVSEVPEELILSMLTSDYEIPRMGAQQPSMQVDWVRVWQ